MIEELRCEIERLRAVEESYRKRSPSVDSASGNTAEMEAELKQLKEDNKRWFYSFSFVVIKLILIPHI